MKGKRISRNTRLGLFVITGTALLIAALYFIGNKQNLFGSTFKVSAQFNNVNGLMAGNNVRFAGINVGTVESVGIINDSSVMVVMVIEEGVREYITKNAVVSIGTDGLMGNKLVNIEPGKSGAGQIEEGDIMLTQRPVDTDEMIRTLNRTNDNVAVITENLRVITQKVNSSNSLWSLLMDTLVAQNVKQAIVNIKITSSNSATLTGDLSSIVREVKQGKGSVGALLMDNTLSDKLNQSIVKIQVIGDSLALVTGDLHSITSGIRNGKGAVGTLLMDTSFVRNLNQSMENLKQGSGNLNQNMEALKSSWPFRKYYRKQKKNGTLPVNKS